MFRSGCAPGIIALLVFPAAFTILGLQKFNGTLDVIEQLSASPSHTIRTEFTGFAPLDEILTNIVLFFWNVVDGTYPPIALFALWMAGQIVCVLIVTMLEGSRTVNYKKAISYFTIWGLLYQSIPWGIMMPVYYATHLVTSPTAHASHAKSKRRLVQFDNSALRVLPWSVLIGCIVPTVLMALPSPWLISHDLHQGFVALWQPFPLWVGLCQFIFTNGVRQSNPPEKEAVVTSQKLIHRICTLCLRLVFLLNAVLGYLIIYSENYSWGSSFGKATLLQKFTQVFIPVPLAEKVTLETLPKGCLALLQYDAYFACGAALIWACVLYRRLVGAVTWSDITGWIARSLIYGPGGAALYVLKRRDDVLFDLAVKED